MQNDEQLSADESYIAERFFEQWLLDWQFVYVEFQRGLLEEADIPAAGWNKFFRSFPAMARYWDQSKYSEFRQDFVAWFDGELLR